MITNEIMLAHQAKISECSKDEVISFSRSIHASVTIHASQKSELLLFCDKRMGEIEKRSPALVVVSKFD